MSPKNRWGFWAAETLQAPLSTVCLLGWGSHLQAPPPFWMTAPSAEQCSKKLQCLLGTLGKGEGALRLKPWVFLLARSTPADNTGTEMSKTLIV